MEELTEATFEQKVLQEKGVVLVDFYTDWCQPCKQIAPVLDELSKEMKQVTFVKVNAEEHPELATKYEVRSVPLLALFKDGKVVETIIGVQPKDVLKEKLAEHISA